MGESGSVKSWRARSLALLAACLAALAAVGGAVAHGDPSSHYLETDSLYPGFANRPSQRVELQLLGLLRAAEKLGYPIKVALVGSEDDLVEQPGMLKTPQRYARFVAAELSSGVPIVVVTPYGIGVTGAKPSLVRALAVDPHATGDDLARAATAVVRRVARAAGRPLPAHVPPASSVATVSSGDDGLGILLPIVLGVSCFALAWLGYEVVTTRKAAKAA